MPVGVTKALSQRAPKRLKIARFWGFLRYTRLKAQDWDSGSINWLLDLIAPVQRTTAKGIARGISTAIGSTTSLPVGAEGNILAERIKASARPAPSAIAMPEAFNLLDIVEIYRKLSLYLPLALTVPKMMERHHIALAASLSLLTIALFAPFTATLGDTTGWTISGPMALAAILLFWSIAAIWSGQLQRLRWAALFGAAGTLLLIYRTYKAQAALDLMRAATGGKIGNPAAGQIQWGWIPFILGIFCLILAVALANEE